MVKKNHPQFSVRHQSELMAVNRNSLKSERAIEPPGRSEEAAQITRRMDKIYLRFPEFGARRMNLGLMREGYTVPVSRRRACRLMEAAFGEGGMFAMLKKRVLAGSNPNLRNKTSGKAQVAKTSGTSKKASFEPSGKLT